MITKVRIAPVEKWCKECKELLSRFRDAKTDPSSGCFISIDTASMRISPLCGGREWRLTAMDEGILALDPFSGKELDPKEYEGYACEHILEMGD